jgi:hypothetical protein
VTINSSEYLMLLAESRINVLQLLYVIIYVYVQYILVLQPHTNINIVSLLTLYDYDKFLFCCIRISTFNMLSDLIQDLLTPSVMCDIILGVICFYMVHVFFRGGKIIFFSDINVINLKNINFITSCFKFS